MSQSDPSFEQRVWLVIRSIPYGNVASYSDVSRLAGHPRAARQVGRILNNLPAQSQLPWHRVVSQQGKISLTGEQLFSQAAALREEGVVVNNVGKINMRIYRWQP
ncbi:MGMT family protein [Rosenbergiella collisarenosi]|uniref:MGMT family protein n=1 Tax=Rosenbergiella collisarenosi TaxID=1544695 RepID=UPI001F4F9D8F|nr:MGMT family protein [Rosenbergiella collisarenosi]